MRPPLSGEPVRAGASATTAAPAERANYSHLRRESARHCEARKADDGSRTRDHRLGKSTGSIRPHNEAGHPPTRRRSIPSPFALTAGTTTRGTLTAGHSVVTVSPSPRVRVSPSGRRDAARTHAPMPARLGFGSPGLPEPDRLTAAAAGCWTGRSSAPARTRTWDLRSRNPLL